MFKEAFTFDKLLNAHKKCRQSKQHKKQTISFEINLSYNLITMSKALIEGTYKVGKYKKFNIYEPKKRVIEALSYKDRVALMAFCTNVLQPKIERYLIYDNAACRKNKGTHFAIERLETFLHKYFNEYGSNGYFLKCDIKKYFQSIVHEILLQKLKKTILDDEDLSFIKMLLHSKNSESGVGLPIGNQTSQWFGLFYLDSVDRLIKEKLRIKYYVRYMDDMILVHHSKEYLQYCKEQIREKVEKELHLSLNSKTQVSQLSSGIDFLGFRHLLTETGQVKHFLRGVAKVRMKKNLKFLSKLKNNGLVDDDFVSIRLNAYKAHIKHSNAQSFLYKRIKQNKLK